jgi:putative membrane protein
VVQPPLWRIFGWYRMQVNVAGYGLVGNNGEGGSRTTLLPVGGIGDVLNMLAIVLPDPGTADPVGVFRGGLDGLDSAGGFVTTPRRGRFLAPLGWRRNGFTATDTALLMRSGRWWRQLVVVPHQRTQSMALHQGPLARRFGVADLVLHTTAGPVTPRVIQASVDEARELFDQQAVRARAARRRQTSEQWLAQVAPLVGQPPLAGPAETDPAPHQPQQEGPQRG